MSIESSCSWSIDAIEARSRRLRAMGIPPHRIIQNIELAVGICFDSYITSSSCCITLFEFYLESFGLSEAS